MTDADEPRCQTCRFWNANLFNDVATDDPDEHIGECRRRAPLPVLVADDSDDSGFRASWPVTTAPDWCGEWQARVSGNG